MAWNRNPEVVWGARIDRGERIRNTCKVKGDGAAWSNQGDAMESTVENQGVRNQIEKAPRNSLILGKREGWGRGKGKE